MKNAVVGLAVVLALLCGSGNAAAQIPVEIFTGHEKATVDVMFFSFFKNSSGKSSRWLFFNRNRASVDYRMTQNSYLPQFGFTEAVSYNHPALKGFAPVVVGQVLSWGVYPKAGIQYARLTKNATLFTWLVAETLQNTDIDYFLLFRYTPPITQKLHLFTQFESVNALPTYAGGLYNFTQRLRLGLKLQHWQFGLGADFNQNGKHKFTTTQNAGLFLRYEF